MTATCHRCGEPLKRVEVTTFSDPEPVYVLGRPCECPGPRCPLCGCRIDVDTRTTSPGQCPNLDCVLYAILIPLPNVA
jgi:hypothetical protein